MEDNDWVVNEELMDRNIEMPLVALVDMVCRNNILPMLRVMVRERRWMDAFEMLDDEVRHRWVLTRTEHLVEVLYGFFYWYMDRENAFRAHIKLEYFEMLRVRAVASRQLTEEQTELVRQLSRAIGAVGA